MIIEKVLKVKEYYTSNSNSKQGTHPFLRRYSTSLNNCSLVNGGRYESVSNFFFPTGGHT
jgi:hypothetical protein